MRILYLDLDTLRPDHLGCYGYHRNTSPNLDALAQQGTVFTNCYCSDAPCLPSRAALMTGQFGLHTGVVGHGATAADMRLEGYSRDFHGRLARENLPAMLRQAGLYTASISPFAERHGAWWFNAGFNEMHNTGKGGMESAEEITPTVLRWIAANAGREDWFLHVNYWDPHTPYRAPEEFGDPFADDPLPEWLTPEIIAYHRTLASPHGAQEISMYSNEESPQYPRHPGEVRDLRDMRRLIDGYDCGLRYMDEHIGRLLAALDEQGVLEDLVIIVSADHGENLGELGIYAEHATPDYATARLPLLVRWPGLPGGRTDTGLHYNLDLAPTLAEMLGREAKPSWDGRSWAPALQRGEDCGREYLVLSQCAHTCMRGVRMGPWMYLRTYHDGYRLFPQEMLYDIEQDPHEQHDLAPAQPEVCREAVWRLNEWHDAMMQSMPYATDPLWTVMREGGPLHTRGHLAAYVERLRATDRADKAEALLQRHPTEL